MRVFYPKALLIFVVNLLFITHHSISQNDCKVTLDAISGQYDGDCKKGLANGSGKSVGTDIYEGEFKKGLPDGYGIYTWSNGSIYKGNFKKGLKEGKGEMSMDILNGEESLLIGYWAKDEYVGPHEKPYKLHFNSSGISSVQVKRTDDDRNILFVTIGRQQSKDVMNPRISIDPTVGFYKMIIPTTRTANVHVAQFPFRFVLTHEGETADIEIYDEGSYNVTVNKKQARLKGQ